MELLVRTFDRYNGQDMRFKSKTSVRGDVVVMQEDGKYWGRCELKNPAFIILRVPILTVEAKAMLSAEVGNPDAKPLLQLREFHLNLDILSGLGYPIPDEAKSRMARYPEGNDVDDYLKLPDNPIIDVTAEDFRTARRRKAPLVDPMVIG